MEEIKIKTTKEEGFWGPYDLKESKEETSQKSYIPHDSVNNPNHYHRGGIECIDALEASMTKEQFLGHLKATAISYLWRYDLKNGLEDVKKARWYIDRLIRRLEK